MEPINSRSASVTQKNKFLFTVFAIFLLVSGCATQEQSRKVAQAHFSGAACSAQGPQILGWNFDWDDNIAYLKTPIVLYKKDPSCKRDEVQNATLEQVFEVGKSCLKTVTTEDFTELRLIVGTPGTELENYELDPNRSFWFFRDQPDRNWFKQHVVDVVSNKKSNKWKGPSWDAFQLALSDYQSSLWTTIITARGHSKPEILEALEYLQKEKLISHLPPVQNLHAVSHPDYKGMAESPSAAKTVVMLESLDCMNQRPLNADAVPVIDQNYNGPGGKDAPRSPKHLWGFSDDDWGNYEKAVNVLGPEVAKNRWPNVKITLFYSGRMKKDEKGNVVPHQTKVIQSNGQLRNQIEDEKTEVITIMKHESHQSN